MRKRTTIEVDEQLLERAKQALGVKTTRATVEEALRRAAEAEEHAGQARAERQRSYFRRLRDLADPAVLSSEDMWR